MIAPLSSLVLHKECYDIYMMSQYTTTTHHRFGMAWIWPYMSAQKSHNSLEFPAGGLWALNWNPRDVPAGCDRDSCLVIRTIILLEDAIAVGEDMTMKGSSAMCSVRCACVCISIVNCRKICYRSQFGDKPPTSMFFDLAWTSNTLSLTRHLPVLQPLSIKYT